LPVSENLNKKVPDSCPHCGNKLSSWQQVLLKVDRAIVCKNCWYRILLDILPEEKNNKQIENNNSKNEAK
jgi:DNA-directed RNA polymerase subunit RPC12/RpoP